MAFFTSPPAQTYFKQLKNHRGYVIIECSRTKTIHSHSIGGLDLCEAKTILDREFELFCGDMGDDSWNFETNRKPRSETSDPDRSSRSTSELGELDPIHAPDVGGDQQRTGVEQLGHVEPQATVETGAPGALLPPQEEQPGGAQDDVTEAVPDPVDDQLSEIVLSKVIQKFKTSEKMTGFVFSRIFDSSS